MGLRVVGTEEQLTGVQNHPKVSLRTAAVAAIRCSQLLDGCRCHARFLPVAA
jgi:hypothetical protein